MSHMNFNWIMSIWTKVNSSWNSLISNVPICWNILFNVSWNIFLTSYTIYIVMAANDCTTIWVGNFLTVFIDVSYCCLLCIWCICNDSRIKLTIYCYISSINFSLTWCVTCNFWSCNFIKATSCPVAIRNNLLSYFVISSSSRQFSCLT